MPNPSPKLRPIDNPIADNINRINKELYDTSQEESIDAEAAETRKINSVQVAIVEDVIVNQAESYDSSWIPTRVIQPVPPVQPYTSRERLTVPGIPELSSPGPSIQSGDTSTPSVKLNKYIDRTFHDDTVAGYNLYRQSLKHTNTFLTRVPAIYHLHQRHKHQVAEQEEFIKYSYTGEWRVHVREDDGAVFPQASDQYIKEILTEEERQKGLAADKVPNPTLRQRYDTHYTEHTIPNELQDMQTLSVATTPIGMRHRAVPDVVIRWQIDQRLFRRDYTHPLFLRDKVKLSKIGNQSYGINTASAEFDIGSLLRKHRQLGRAQRARCAVGIYLETPGDVYMVRNNPGYVDEGGRYHSVRTSIRRSDRYPITTGQLTWMSRAFTYRRSTNDRLKVLYRPDLSKMSAISAFFNVYLTITILHQRNITSPDVLPTTITQQWPDQLPRLDSFEVWPYKPP